MNEPRKKDDKIRCDACPVMCYIAEGRTGACDRYANDKGDLLRVDPLKIIILKQHSAPLFLLNFILLLSS